MTDQLELDGLNARHQGQDANLAAGTKPYRDDRHRVEVAVATYARSGALFTADDVHKAIAHDGIEAGYDRNLVSSVLGVWSKDGRIRQIARSVSTSRTRHASRNAVWVGTEAARGDHTVPAPR